MTQHPFGWFEKISQNVPELKKTPLFGHTPPLCLEKLTSLLKESFGVQDFSIRTEPQKIKETSDLKAGLGKSLIVTPLTISPLETPLYWVMSKTDRNKISGWIFSCKENKKIFSSAPLQEGFYRFLLLKALHCAQTLDPLQQMTLQLEEESSLPEEKSFCIDVEISFGKTACWGRLIFTKSFQQNWVHHFAAFPPEYIPTDATRSLFIHLGIQIGSVLLNAKEWEELNPGDFIIPDELITQPNQPVLLTLNKKPLFKANMQKDTIELIDYITTSESPMADSLITIELAQISMSLDELMHLSTGKSLEKPPLKNSKVSLHMRGRKIGDAEILTLGDILGLRLLDK